MNEIRRLSLEPVSCMKIKPLYLLLCLLFLVGCAAEKETETSDPRLQKVQTAEVHAELGALYAYGAH